MLCLVSEVKPRNMDEVCTTGRNKAPLSPLLVIVGCYTLFCTLKQVNRVALLNE